MQNDKGLTFTLLYVDLVISFESICIITESGLSSTNVRTIW